MYTATSTHVPYMHHILYHFPSNNIKKNVKTYMAKTAFSIHNKLELNNVLQHASANNQLLCIIHFVDFFFFRFIYILSFGIIICVFKDVEGGGGGCLLLLHFPSTLSLSYFSMFLSRNPHNIQSFSVLKISETWNIIYRGFVCQY